MNAARAPKPRGALLVDMGNSRVKWRHTGVRNCDGSCPNESLVDGAPLSWRALVPPKWVLIAAMPGQAPREGLAAWCRGQWDVEARFADALSEVPGLENRYANPTQLGVDRWLALIAARRLGGGPVVVVDCGTAITVDLVDGTGVFHGGMILPGRRLLESAFSERVAHLELPAERPATFPADNTADAIALGIEYAVVASLDRFIENCRPFTRDEPPTVYLTGGDGPWLSERWDHPHSVHGNLVLDGLNFLMEHEH